MNLKTASISALFDPSSPILLSLPFLLLVFKVLFIIAWVLYIIYALVIVRQISLMARTVSTSLEIPLKLLGWLHLFAAIAILFLAISA